MNVRFGSVAAISNVFKQGKKRLALEAPGNGFYGAGTKISLA